uniref:DNA repair protein RAD50 n=1 Tax=Dunaliella tertiolecta TaxID=3047 RepID=A0A7S3VU85_DUNTE
MCTVDKLLIKGIRSFSPDNMNVIEFYRPLTLIVGVNGAGKTTVIECLKQACTGELPPNTRSGQSFIHDPRMANETDIKAQIKLRFLTSSKQPVVVVRSFQLIEKKTTRQFKTLDSTLQTVDPVTGVKQAVTYRCLDIDKMVPSLMGVSKAVLDNVIFVHQEESNWPLAEGKVLKDKFDDIFSATKYTKALETLRKMRLEKTQEIKVKREVLDHTRTHRNTATKLQAEIQRAEEEILDGEEKMRNLDQQITEKVTALAALNDTLARQRVLSEERKIRSVRREELAKQAAAKLEALQAGGVDPQTLRDSLEDMQQLLSAIDVDVEESVRQVTALQREIKGKRLNIQAENQQQNMDVARHGRLAAEKATHEQRLAEREQFIRDTAASLGWSLPSGLQALDTAAAQSFHRELTALVANKGENVRSIKASNRKEDENAAQVIENLAEQITRKQAELRVKQGQVNTNNQTIDNLLAQISDIHTNEQALEDARTKIEDIGDQLRKRRHEQSTGKLDEKVVSLKRELDDLAAKISDLRMERNRVVGSSDAQMQLRMKRAAIQDKEKKLSDVLTRRRRELIQLLGTAELPAPQALKHACQSALLGHQQKLDELNQELKSAQALESQVKGQLSAARSQLNTATQQHESLRSQVRARQVQLPMVESVDLQILDGVLAKHTEAATKKRKRMDNKTYLQKNLMAFRQLICDQEKEECPVCRRKFSSEDEKQAALASLDEELMDLPEKIAREQHDAKEAEVTRASLQELRGLVEKMVVLETEQIKPLTQRKQALEGEHAEVGLRVEDLVEQCAVMDHDVKSKKELVAEVRLMLDHVQQELGVLREEVARMEARLSSQSVHARSTSEIDEELEGLEVERESKEREREVSMRKQNKLKEEMLALTQEESEAKSRVAEAAAARNKRVECTAKVEELQALNAELTNTINRFTLELKPLNASREGHIKDRSLARRRMQAAEEAAEAELREVSKTADTLADKIRPIVEYELSGQAGELEQMAAKMQNFQRKITALNQDLEETERRYLEYQEHQAAKDQHKRLVQDCLDLKQVQQQVAIQDNEISELEQQQAQLGSTQELLQQQASLEQARNSLQRQLDRLQGAKGTHEMTRARASKDLQAPELHKIHVKYNQTLAELMYTEMANSDLDKYHKALEKALLSFHTTKMADINKIVKELWQKTYRGQDIDYIKIVADADGARSYNYRVIMVVGGAELEMRGRCSAGQKVLACLVIRLALAETFCLNCGILALDEPTTNLDADNASSLAEALKAIMFSRKDQENFQLIVITHDESFAHQIGTREHAEYLWRIVKDEDGHTLIHNDLIAGQ